MALEPGDRISISGLLEGPFEITEIRDGAVRRVSAGAVMRGDAVAAGVDSPRFGAGEPMAEIAPLLVTAHLPAPAGDFSRSRLAIAAHAIPWPGMVRVNEAATGARLAELTRPAFLGTLLAPLQPGPRATWDRGQGLEVEMLSGHPADVTELAALAGSNRLALENDLGLWEIIGFAGAELLAPNRYRLTRLLRGLEGSDAAMAPASTGRRIMLLDQRVAMLPIDAHWIGESRVLHCFAGDNDAIGQELALSLDAPPALPLAPCHLRARRTDDGGIAFDWTRRSRADGDGWGMAEPALDHVPEGWRLTIFADGGIARVIEATTPTARYGAAEQNADFGGPAGPFHFSVAQLSPVLGPGHAAREIFHG